MPLVHEIGAMADRGTVLAVLELLWVLGVTGWMLLERRSPTATIAWILALSAIPVLGIPVYLFLGPRRLERKKVRLALARRGRDTWLRAWEAEAEGEPAGRQQLMRLATQLAGTPPETALALSIQADGDGCLDALEKAIGEARNHVHLEYYIFRADRAGTRIRDALVERARAGVQVRLLVDAVGSASLGSRFLAPLRSAGGEVARFNPGPWRRLRRPLPNFRTHRKIAVCDGLVGFTGGMNISDDQSRSAAGPRAWRDTHLRIEGAAVHGLQLTFLEDWAFATGRGDRAPSLQRLLPYFPQAPRGSHRVQIVASGPDQDVHAIEAFYFAAITGARERVWITTPYFVPDESLVAALRSAALRGVDVRLILPHRTDSRLVDAAGSTYHDALLDAGARIFFYEPSMIHAKTGLFDRDLAVVGTANLDNRSLRLNFEVVAAIYGGPAVEELAALFERDLAHCRPRARREARGPLGRRLLASAARLLAPQL